MIHRQGYVHPSRAACASVVTFVACIAGCAAPRSGGIVALSAEDRYDTLAVKVLRDDLVRCEWRTREAGAPPVGALPFVVPQSFGGPREFRDLGGGRYETAELRIEIDRDPTAVRVFDRVPPGVRLLAEFRPLHRGGRRVLDIQPGGLQHVYGLGQQFGQPGQTDGDWTGRRRTPGNEYGNALTGYCGGAVGNIQIPVMFAVGERGECLGVLMDESRAIEWDFTREPWTAAVENDRLSWCVMTGPTPLDARADYMALSGRPPVPPKQAFGLWVCEYGYDDWAELLDKLRTLEANHFPIDGFILDLQWFGGIESGERTRMGRLTWDTAKFPDAAGTLARLRAEHGVGVMHIEESFVGAGLAEFAEMAREGLLVANGRGDGPVRLNEWWGAGGMIDWLNPAAGDAWHDRKRRPLIRDGVFGHWCDLGEPENFDPEGRYFAPGGGERLSQRDAHNLYGWRWIESIARGYERGGETRRPFMISRTGGPGVQRFGAALWSGDIPSSSAALAAHLNAQMHMSMSGIDYYGSDIGGFRRRAADGDMSELYTRWLADGLAIDVPARTHTANTRNEHETAPDRIGDLRSNLANVRLRYELIPYLYSLAHRAWRFGEPVFPPLMAAFPKDATARRLGGQKMIGRDLLVQTVASAGTTWSHPYLPTGRWIDWHTLREFDGEGRFVGVPLHVDGVFRLPLLARAGAIVPLMHVDEQTSNALGRRRDGTRRDELVVRVFADRVPSEFTLFEDDGETVAYRGGAVRETRVTQHINGETARVAIEAARGEYSSAPAARGLVVQLVPPANRSVARVRLNGAELPRGDGTASTAANWFMQAGRMAVAQRPAAPVSEQCSIEFELVPAPKPAVPERDD